MTPANPGGDPVLDSTDRWALLAVLAAAFLSRLAVPYWLPGIHHPDEIFQSLEQAHRLVFGYGVVPWEFRDGARSWLLPGLLSLPMWLGEQLAPGTTAYRYFAVGLVALLSASIPVVGYLWGRRYSRTHAWLAAAVLLGWHELVLFGARALAEVVGGTFLFAGVWLCSERDTDQPRRRALLAGLCLGLAFVFRFHLAPAIALAAIWLARGDLRDRWLPMLAGGIAPVALLGTIDWITWGVPFRSVIGNFAANIVEGRSHIYGVSPWYWYLWQFGVRWQVGAALLLLPALLWSRRQPLPLLTAAVIVVAHSAIAHKEYRFLYPAIPLVLVAAALGAAEISLKLRAAGRARWLPAALVALALLGSLTLSLQPPAQDEWLRGKAGLELLARAGREAHCGVALVGGRWDMTGGYTWLHRDLPLHLLYPDDRAKWDLQSFDVWIAPEGWLQQQVPAPGFVQRECTWQGAQGFRNLCYWRRSGACRANPSTEAPSVMQRYGY